MPTDVLLLRAPTIDANGVDKYENAFHTRGYRAVSIPVLETVHKKIEELKRIVRAGSTYAGVIVTSARACEAWRAVVQQLADEGGESKGEQGEGGWTTTPFYVVGEATASALSAIRTSFPTSPYAPLDVRGGPESGSGEKLGHFIVSDLTSNPTSRGKMLLYLVGDKNRDTLPNIVREAGFELESLQVYATQGSSRFEDDLWSMLDGVQGLDPDSEERWWIVYFAPSTAKHVSPILSKHFRIPTQHEPAQVANSLRRAQLAVIGPTTASALQSDLGLKIDVVSENPTPESLVEGIVKWDGEHRS